MRKSNSRKIKVLGGAWLGLGGLAFGTVLVVSLQVLFSSQDVEGGFVGGLIFVLVLLAVGAVFSVNGFAPLRRNSVARPLVAISSLILLIPSVAGTAAGGIGVPLLLVVVPSLWLTLSRGGKKAFESHIARENG